MGRDLARAALRRGRGAVLGAVLGTALSAAIVGAGGPATADDVASPGADPGQAVTPSVSPPSEEQINDARDALNRLRNQRKKAAPASPTALTQVAGPVAKAADGSMASQISDQTWWTIGAAAMVLLVASETTRISVRRAKHRGKA